MSRSPNVLCFLCTFAAAFGNMVTWLHGYTVRGLRVIKIIIHKSQVKVMNILGICILASVVILVAGAAYVTKMVMEAKAKIAALENNQANRAVLLPLRLQAYERMALFLERIDPNQLVLRIHNIGLTVSQEQNLLLTAIRSEFEHNLSQQIYLSDQVWAKVCDAKGDIEEIINTVAGDYDKDADSREFAETVLAVSSKKPVVELAIQILKADMQKWAY